VLHAYYNTSGATPRSAACRPTRSYNCGLVLSKVSQGTNRLIRNGATIATQAEDILEALNLTARATQQEVQTAFPDDPTELALLELISYEPQHVDELRLSSGLPIAIVSSTLALLELKGLVRQAGLMQYVLAREERAEYQVEGAVVSSTA
jgi:DNA processing protein